MKKSSAFILRVVAILCWFQISSSITVYLEDQVEFELVRFTFDTEYSAVSTGGRTIELITRKSDDLQEEHDDNEFLLTVEQYELEAVSDVEAEVSDLRDCIKEMRGKINSDKISKKKIDSIIQYSERFKKQVKRCEKKCEQNVKNLFEEFIKKVDDLTKNNSKTKSPKATISKKTTTPKEPSGSQENSEEEEMYVLDLTDFNKPGSNGYPLVNDQGTEDQETDLSTMSTEFTTEETTTTTTESTTTTTTEPPIKRIRFSPLTERLY